MSLIDTSYFVGEINIPLGTRDEVTENLNLFISKYESQLLLKVLGYELFKAYTAGIAVGSPEQKWVDLRDGKEYTGNDGRIRKWVGFKDSANKLSFIADYVYYWWMRNQATQTGGVGEVSTTTENAVRTSPAMKMARAWNEVHETVNQLMCFLQANRSVYTDWHPADAWSVRKEFAFMNPLF
jgi:hypothetical protein